MMAGWVWFGHRVFGWDERPGRWIQIFQLRRWDELVVMSLVSVEFASDKWRDWRGKQRVDSFWECIYLDSNYSTDTEGLQENQLGIDRFSLSTFLHFIKFWLVYESVTYHVRARLRKMCVTQSDSQNVETAVDIVITVWRMLAEQQLFSYSSVCFFSSQSKSTYIKASDSQWDMTW